MANPELVQYLKDGIAHGHGADQLRAELVNRGWNEFDIGLAWAAATTKTPPKRERLKAANLLLFTGALIIIVGAATLISANWGNLNSAFRILVILIPDLALIMVGMKLWGAESNRRVGHYFLVTGGLIWPATIGILLFETIGQADLAYGVVEFIIALSTLLLYLSALVVYRRVIWAPLATMAAIAVYFYFLTIIKIDDWWAVNPWAWAFLFFGIALFAIGLWAEKSQWKYESRSPYFFGILSILVPLVYLGVSGQLFGTRWQDTFSPHDSIGPGMTTFLVGFIFLLFAWGSRYLKNSGYHQAGTFTSLWEFAAGLALPGAWLIAGSSDQVLMMSIIAVLFSAALFYLAIKIQSPAFYRAGAVMMVVSLLEIGAVHFRQTISWPMFLILAGLLIMGGGYVLTRL